MIRLRFAKIIPCEKSTGSQFAKLNPREMLKMTRENKSTRKFLSLRQRKVSYKLVSFKKTCNPSWLFTCSKLIIQTIEQSVKYIQS